MDVIFELVFQLIFEVVAQALLERGFGGAAKVLRSAIGRAVLGAFVGLGFGIWWGDRLSDLSLVHRPRLLWVSIAIAGVALVQALLTRRDPDRGAAASPARRILDPRVWPTAQLVSFALLNLGIAAGIEIGFDSPMR